MSLGEIYVEAAEQVSKRVQQSRVSRLFGFK